MMIFLEGKNCVGKTTLARLLCERYNFKYIKEDKPNKPGFQYYVEKLVMYDDDIVVDRFHLGEMVYPILFNDDRILLKRYQQHAIERMINNLNAILIYVDATEKFIKNVFEIRGEKDITFEQSRIEDFLFKKALKTSILKNIIYYSPEFSLYEKDNFFLTIDDKIKLYNDNLRRFKGNGDINAKIMLVGERFNKNSKLEDKFAFSDFKGASDYLAKVLFLLHEDVYLTNSIKDDNLSILDEIKLIKPMLIISLGNVASKILDSYKIRYFKVEHPQYWRRFRYNDIKVYVNKFKKIIKDNL